MSRKFRVEVGYNASGLRKFALQWINIKKFGCYFGK